MASQFLEPSDDNDFLSDHVQLLQSSYLRLTGNNITGLPDGAAAAARAAYHAPFVLLSHGCETDPVFNYANLTAQTLFEMDWSEITQMPSRRSAEAPDREERARLLAEVTSKGLIQNYAGVRISKSGRRFLIRQAIVWNLADDSGTPKGQAALFADWSFI